MVEEWKPIPSAPGYEANSEGLIRTQDRVVPMGRRQRHVNGCVIRPVKNKNGYLYVSIYLTGNKRRTTPVHKLIAEAFLGECPSKYVVSHIDGNKLNNQITNLEYATQSNNLLARRIHGTAPLGEINPQSKLVSADIRNVRALAQRGASDAAIAYVMKCSTTNVRLIRHRKTWTHI